MLEERAGKAEDDYRDFYKELIALRESFDKSTSDLNVWKTIND